MTERNARFWVWHQGKGTGESGWVKLTLKPGQRVETEDGGRTDEGWSHEASSWELEDGIVKRQYFRSGRDCDGRSDYHHEDECPLDLLTDSETCGDDPVDFHNGVKILHPSWGKAERSQRDYAAEAAGY